MSALPDASAQVLRYVCWAAGYLANSPDTHRDALIKAGIGKRLFRLVSHPSVAVQKPAVIALAILSARQLPITGSGLAHAWVEQQRLRPACIEGWNVTLCLQTVVIEEGVAWHASFCKCSQRVQVMV